MITSEFEKLKAGSTIYDFTSLTAGQIIITVALVSTAAGRCRISSPL
jgi:hypothetical protein